MAVGSGSLTAAGVGTSVAVQGEVAVSMWRTASGNKTSQITIERSHDQGTTWVPVWLPAFGGTSFTTDSTLILVEPAGGGMLYRVRAASVTSGETINWRIEQ